nr:uncharacterized protein LOC124813808 isoform X1 [Hydra vulgaris]
MMASNRSDRRRASYELSTFFSSIRDQNCSIEVNGKTLKPQVDRANLYPVDFSISDVCFESNENNLNYSDSDLYLNEEDCMLSESEDLYSICIATQVTTRIQSPKKIPKKKF